MANAPWFNRWFLRRKVRVTIENARTFPGELHLFQAKHNERLLEATLFRQDASASMFTDWIVTIACYVALHYFEAYCSRKGYPRFGNWPHRNRFIERSDDAKLRTIQKTWFIIYKTRGKASYDPMSYRSISLNDARTIEDWAKNFIPRTLGFK
jgi:hypothetical protein